MDKVNETQTKHRKELDALKDDKVEVQADNKNRRKLFKKMREIEVSHGILFDQQVSLESFVEKYLPLKM